MKTIIFLVHFLDIFNLNAQNIDSLNHLISTASEMKKIDLYYELAIINQKTNPNKAIEYNWRSIQLANRKKVLNGKYNAYVSLGIIYKNIGLYDSSLIFFNEAHIISQQTDNEEEEAKVMHNISSSYILMGNYPKALEYLTKSLLIFEKENNKEHIAKSYVNIGELHQRIGNNELAEKNLKKAIQIAQEINNQSLLAAAQNTYGIFLANQNKLDSALNYFLNSATLREKINEPSELYWNYNNIGGIYYYFEQFDNAIKYFSKSLDLAHKMNSKIAIATVYNNLGAIYKEKKKFEKSIEMHQLALEMALELKDSDLTKDALENLYHTYQEKGDYSNALKYHTQFKQYSDSIFSKEKSEQLANIQSEYDTQFKVKELKQEKELAVANAVSEKKTKNIYLILSISIFFLFIAIIVIIAIRVQRKKAQIDAEIQKERTNVIIETQESERARIAKDLHDGVVQEITAIKLSINSFKNEIDNVNQYKLENIIKDLDKTSKEVRNISYQMMPFSLKELGIIKALEELLHKTYSQTKINYHFDYFGIEQRLSEKIEVSIYRICQELINNSLKHSNASNISVLLLLKQNILTLTFEDNGKGFDVSKVSKGIGLHSLNSRIELVQGSLQIESNERIGTIAYIKIPIA